MRAFLLRWPHRIERCGGFLSLFSVPGPALVEELAARALQTGRRDEVRIPESFRVGVHKPEQTRLLCVRHRLQRRLAVMSAPTPIQRAHYDKLVGRQITAIIWEEIEGQALPILLLSGWDRDGNAATVTVLVDPAGNGPGHLDHKL